MKANHRKAHILSKWFHLSWKSEWRVKRKRKMFACPRNICKSRPLAEYFNPSACCTHCCLIHLSSRRQDKEVISPLSNDAFKRALWEDSIMTCCPLIYGLVLGLDFESINVIKDCLVWHWTHWQPWFFTFVFEIRASLCRGLLASQVGGGIGVGCLLHTPWVVGWRSGRWRSRVD